MENEGSLMSMVQTLLCPEDSFCSIYSSDLIEMCLSLLIILCCLFLRLGRLIGFYDCDDEGDNEDEKALCYLHTSLRAIDGRRRGCIEV